MLPVGILEKGGDVGALLEQSGAFGAVVLDGMMVEAVRVGAQATLLLIGPGALVPGARGPRSMPVAGASLRVLTRTRLLLLDDQFFLAVRHWPEVVSCLHARMLEQCERLTAQLAISQLPRVEDRV